METIDYTDKNISFEEFLQLINTARKNNKNDWYIFVGYVEGKKVALKGYNTWLQRYLVDSLYQPGPMEISVKHFIQNLKRPFN